MMLQLYSGRQCCQLLLPVLLEDTVSTETTVTQCFHRQPDGAVWVLVLSGRHPFPGCRLYKMTLDGCCFFTFILCYSAFRFIGKFLLVVLLQRAAMLALQALY